MKVMLALFEGRMWMLVVLVVLALGLLTAGALVGLGEFRFFDYAS